MKEVVRALLGERRRDPEQKVSQAIADELKAWGVSSEKVDTLRPDPADEERSHVVEVEPELWNAFRVFRQLYSTQWKWETVTNGKKVIAVRHGLDYGAAAVVAGGMGVAQDDVFWDFIGAMETEALSIYRARAEKALRL